MELSSESEEVSDHGDLLTTTNTDRWSISSLFGEESEQETLQSEGKKKSSPSPLKINLSIKEWSDLWLTCTWNTSPLVTCLASRSIHRSQCEGNHHLYLGSRPRSWKALRDPHSDRDPYRWHWTIPWKIGHWCVLVIQVLSLIWWSEEEDSALALDYWIRWCGDKTTERLESVPSSRFKVMEVLSQHLDRRTGLKWEMAHPRKSCTVVAQSQTPLKRSDWEFVLEELEVIEPDLLADRVQFRFTCHFPPSPHLWRMQRHAEMTGHLKLPLHAFPSK